MKTAFFMGCLDDKEVALSTDLRKLLSDIELKTELSFEQYVRAMSFHLAEACFTAGNLTTLFDVHDEILRVIDDHFKNSGLDSEGGY